MPPGAVLATADQHGEDHQRQQDGQDDPEDFDPVRHTRGLLWPGFQVPVVPRG